MGAQLCLKLLWGVGLSMKKPHLWPWQDCGRTWKPSGYGGAVQGPQSKVLFATVQTIEPEYMYVPFLCHKVYFLTCTESNCSFLYWTKHIIVLRRICSLNCMERKVPYLEWWLLVLGCESPSLLVPAQSQLPYLRPPYLPWHSPLSPSSCQYVYKHIETTLIHPSLLFFRYSNNYYNYIQMTLISPNPLLSGTLPCWCLLRYTITPFYSCSWTGRQFHPCSWTARQFFSVLLAAPLVLPTMVNGDHQGYFLDSPSMVICSSWSYCPSTVLLLDTS